MFQLFKIAGEDEELRALLGEYGIWNDIPAGAGAYGRVYFGRRGGRPVAVKIEPRDSGSAEYAILGRLRELRAGAPGHIKQHLPVIHELGCGSAFCYYVMEILRPLDRGVARDLVGSDWQLDDGAGGKTLPQIDTAAVNSEPDAVLVSGEAAEKLGDSGLVARAFDEWFARHAVAVRGFFGSGDSAAFKSAALQVITNVCSSLSNDFKRGGAAGLGDIARLLEARLVGALRGRERAAARALSGVLPELLFAIIRAGWLPRFHAARRDDDAVAPYETLHRSESLLGEDSDRRSLRATLEWLGNHGILSGDVHEENIMQRPDTGDWVLIDYSLYRLATEND